MSRFVNLEVGDDSEDRSEPPAVVKDDLYHLRHAQQAFESGRFEHALRSYARVLEYNPQSEAAWVGQVRMLIELGEPHEARLWADKALERFPQAVELLAAKAVALGRTGDLAGALAFSDASFEGRGDSVYLWLARGDVLLARNERRADFCFDRATLQVPRDWCCQWLASRIRFDYRHYALAFKHAKLAVDLDPSLFIVWLQLGLCQQALGMTSASRHSFTQALQLNPRCIDAEEARRRSEDDGLWIRLRGSFRRLFSL